jgi:hypothetical protein
MQEAALSKLRSSAAMLLVLFFFASFAPFGAVAQNGAPASAVKLPVGILDHEQASAVLPATVFYRGQTASIQARNSAGIRVADGRLILATLVDNSGYSSSIQQTYQAYLISEVPLRVGDRGLPAGAYGFGFVAGGQMVVLDLGGHEVFRTATVSDAAMKRPRPLQITADPGSASSFRLYLGRSFVTLAASKP